MNRPTRESASGRAYLDLQNQARREKKQTQDLLTMYVVERWLDRMSRSKYSQDFILKGGMLLAAIGSRRPTSDADTLARNMPADEETVAIRVAEIAALADPADGVEYLADTIKTVAIRDDAMYGGIRVTMDALLGTAVLKLKLDINFGDPVTPGPQMIELPSLRTDTPPVVVLGYTTETVLAEKIVTALALGDFSTRVRDWGDVYVVSRSHDFAGQALRAAIDATAAHRNEDIRPLSDAIGDIAALRANTWAAYRRNLGPDGEQLPLNFAEVVGAVVAFSDPVLADPPAATWNAATTSWS